MMSWSFWIRKGESAICITPLATLGAKVSYSLMPGITFSRWYDMAARRVDAYQKGFEPSVCEMSFNAADKMRRPKGEI